MAYIQTQEDSIEGNKDGKIVQIESSTEMENVSNWVRRSVLFWNKPDTVSMEGVSDTQEHEMNRFCSFSVDQENASKSSIETVTEGEERDVSSHLESKDDSTTEPTNFLSLDKETSTGDMILDVENIQRHLIEPFIMEQGLGNKEGSCDSLNNDSPYYTLNFPKYTEHVYSPLYEEHSGLLKENRNPTFVEKADWNIADILNKVNHTGGQVETSNENSKVCQKDNVEEHGKDIIKEEMDNKHKSLDTDILGAIKRVQDTLGEIADELETYRTRKTSRDRDPNLILVNLLSRIQPPVNRDSFASSPTDDAPEAGREEKTAARSTIQGSKALSSIHKNQMSEDLSKTGGDEEEFDVFKELSDPEKSTEEVLQDFMDKISNMSKPSSALRGFLKRISEEVASDNSFDQSVLKSNKVSDALAREKNEDSKEGDKNGVSKAAPCTIIVDHDSGTEREGDDIQIQRQEGIEKPERRVSAVSAASSLPTSPNATNYDSGFSELTKNLTYTRKESLASFAPDESMKSNIERRLKDTFEKSHSKAGFDSETSTDWSPCSTLSYNESAFKQKSALKHSPFQRVSPRRRSTGTTSSKPTFRIQPGNTNSCPNFDRNVSGPMHDSANHYTRAEVEAIRKFLSLTSLYFGSRGIPSNIPSTTYDELIQRGDIEVIHNILQRQREDLERQRRKQDDLYGHLGDLLLQLVTLKEEHLSSTQKQTKALTLLKKQLDMQKKEQLRAQDAIKEQVKTLGEKFTSNLSVSHENNNLPELASPLPNLHSTNKHIGQIIWKITGITRKVTRLHAGATDNVTVSEPFYSDTYGYKMAAWVYLNGRADFRGKGISVYVCPLCGEYDAILPWPIKPVYTFTLIDQNPDPKLRRNHIKVRNVVEISKKCDTALSNKGGIPRPQQGSKSFIIGFDDFISQSELASGNYIFDDTLFLKVEAVVNY